MKIKIKYIPEAKERKLSQSMQRVIYKGRARSKEICTRGYIQWIKEGQLRSQTSFQKNTEHKNQYLPKIESGENMPGYFSAGLLQEAKLKENHQQAREKNVK